MSVDLELIEAVQDALRQANHLQHELTEMLSSDWFTTRPESNISLPPQPTQE